VNRKAFLAREVGGFVVIMFFLFVGEIRAQNEWNIVCHLQTQTNSLVGGNWSDLISTTNPFVIVPDPIQTNVFYRLESP
jgi:hypothetical protein